MNIFSRYSLPFVFLTFSLSAHAFDFSRLMASPEFQPYIQGLMKNRQVQGMMRQMASVDRVDADYETQFNESYYVRSGPGTAYRHMGTVGDFEGAAKPTGKRSGKWVEVKFDNGKRGWVSAKAVSRVAKKEAPEEKQAKVEKPQAESVNEDGEDSLAKPVESARTEEKVAKVDPVKTKPAKTDSATLEQSTEKTESTKPTAQSTAAAAAKKPEAKIIDKSKPQCAESQAELDANPSLKNKLNGYNPFAGWSGGKADIVQNPETGKMQVEVRQSYASLAETFGFPRVNPTDMKVCIDFEDASPYLFVGGKKYDRLPTSVKLGSGFKSETFKIQTSR